MRYKIHSYQASIVNEDGEFDGWKKVPNKICNSKEEIEDYRKELKERLMKKNPDSTVNIAFTYKEIE